MMLKLTEHWNSIFTNQATERLGWQETDVSQTLKFIKKAALPACPTYFIPGAGASPLIGQLLNHNAKLILNDISDRCLFNLRETYGEHDCEYLHHDIATPLQPPQQVDFWLDRAVLHFLLEESQITGYFNNLKASLSTGGYVLLAQFAHNGATKCAGLPIKQYSLTQMQQRLGNEFTLLAHEHYTFTTPSGQSRPYLYALFQAK